jgi:outer membrane receptor protein involved in Fe transport
MSWKVGVNLERFEQKTRQVEYTSLTYGYRSFDQLPYSGTRIPATDLAVDLTEYAVFVENDWYAGPAWTLNLGLRYEYDDLVGRHALEPRLGAAHDLGGDGKSVLRFGVGLYHDRTNLIGHTGALRPPAIPFVVDQLTGTFLLNPANEHVVDPDLELPGITKWVVGYERQLGRRSQIGFHLYGSHGRELFYTERTNRRGASGSRPDPTKGTVDVYTNTGSSDVYDLEIAWRHVFSNGSLIQASYTYEDATGNSAFDFWSGNHPLEVVGASLESGPIANVEGPLDHEVEHAFKLSAVGRLPYGFQLSGFLDWHTGLPYTVRDDFFYPWYGTAFVDGYNSRTMDGFLNLDLRIGWQVGLGRGHQLEIFFDAFNVTDEENVLEVDGVRRYNFFGNGLDPGDMFWMDNPRFLEPLFTGARRSYQLGLRWSF